MFNEIIFNLTESVHSLTDAMYGELTESRLLCHVCVLFAISENIRVPYVKIVCQARCWEGIQVHLKAAYEQRVIY